jgi:putative ABC transport system permease protein
MIKNNLLIAFRQFRNFYSQLNFIGLVIGFTVFILILSWVNEEVSYDHFHPDYQSTYRVLDNMPKEDGGIQISARTPAPLAAKIKAQIEGIDKTCYLRQTEFFIKHEETGFYKFGVVASPDFFRMFHFPVVKGSIEGFEKETDKIIITESLARIYFGDQDPIGKTFTVAYRDIEVIAVIKDVPTHSHMQFDYVIPTSFLKAAGIADLDSWKSYIYHTYIQSNKNAGEIEAKIQDIINKDDPEANSKLSIQKLEDVHLHSQNIDGNLKGQGNVMYVKLFSWISIFILVIVCINYSNLATAKSIKRAKEIGVRKVIGAQRAQLVGYFFLESFVYVVFAFGLALALSWLLFPSFNKLAETNLTFSLSQPRLWIYLVSAIVASTVLSGLFPAWIVSAQNPIAALKGFAKASTKTILLRRTLLVIQFVVSISLLLGTLMVQQHLNYIQTKDLGYTKERVLSFTAIRKIRAEYPSLKQELLALPEVESVSANSANISFADNWNSAIDWNGKNKDLDIPFYQLMVDADFIKTYSIQLTQGRSFSSDIISDSSAVILNEEALKQIGFKDPIHQIIKIDDQPFHIVGIAKNFHFKSMHHKIDPMILFINPAAFYLVSVKLSPGNTLEQMKKIETIYKKYAQDRPFDYTFLEDDLNKLYVAEARTEKIFTSFSILAFFISAMGLIGIVLFSSEQRSKEMAIRKVIGASVAQLMNLLSFEYILIALIGFCIAAPLMYVYMDRWLQDFAYHDSISPYIFALTGFMSLVFPWFIVSFQTFRAARQNPVKNLKND